MSTEQTWIFTFGHGQKGYGHYVKVKGSYIEARNKMFDRYGKHWAFQYSEEDWDKWVKECEEMGVRAETEIPF